LILADGEIVLAFIKAETHMDHDNSTFAMSHHELGMRDATVKRVVKDKIGTNESKREASPWTDIHHTWDALVMLVALEGRLGIFCNTGTRKNAKMQPVPNHMVKAIERGDQIT
jgi:hypothetical protein